MMLKIVCAALALLLLGYILGGRAWLKKQSWAQGFFAWIEPIEMLLWKKSETILFSRLLVIGGLIPPLLDQLSTFNIPEIQNLLPEEWRGYWTLAFSLIGIISEFNRRYTTKPLEQVALPEAVLNTPAVAAQVAKAETANAAAVVAAAKV